MLKYGVNYNEIGIDFQIPSYLLYSSNYQYRNLKKTS